MKTRRHFIVIIAVWVGFQISATTRASSSAAEIVRKLDALKDTIARESTAVLKTNQLTGSYTTVWREFEDQVIVALEEILPRHIPELTVTNFDGGKSGKEKNRLADLAILTGGEKIEISVKAARRSGNPENDMGTFHDHPNRKQLFVASFTAWVRYDDSTKEIRCERVFFDRTWRFVGRSSLMGGVKYRKKDGNMRPKPWTMFESGESHWKSEAEFEAAVAQSERFRANELIKQYLEDLSENDQRLLFNELKAKFERH